MELFTVCYSAGCWCIVITDVLIGENICMLSFVLYGNICMLSVVSKHMYIECCTVLFCVWVVTNNNTRLTCEGGFLSGLYLRPSSNTSNYVITSGHNYLDGANFYNSGF